MIKQYFHAIVALATLLVAGGAMAAPVDSLQARQQALSFLSQHATAGSKRAPGNASLRLAYAAKGNAYYAFNATSGGGYVLVAGDDCLPAVLGYSDEGEFDPSNIPANMQEWLDDYAEQVRYVQSHSGARISASTSHTAGNVYPLLGNIKWNQGAPYNNLCPTYTNSSGTVKRAVTGCVATAMAQLMYYHRWPIDGSSSNTYTTILNGQKDSTLQLSVDFGQSHYDWNNMLPSYSGSETEAQNNAVAKLMSDCGVAVNMNYGSSSSAYTSSTMNKMAVHFGYDKSLRFIYRDAYTLDAWLDIINGELSSQRPVLYSGRSSSGGHAFVVDGCNTSGYYHMNWGWGGASNGYFLLTDLTPADQGIGSSEGGYNQSQGMLYHLMPNQGTTTDGLVGHLSAFTTSSEKVLKGLNASITWKYYNVISTAEGDASARLALAITDDSGNVVQIGAYRDVTNYFKLGYLYTYTWKMQVPTSLSAGTYYIVPMVAPVNSTDYTKMDVSLTTNQRIKMVVDGLYAYFSYPDNAPQLSVKSYDNSSVLAATRPIDVKATIANTGNEYNGNLRIALLDSAGHVAAASVPKSVDITTGGEATLETTVTPTAAGSYQLAVVYAADSTVVAGAQKSLTIAAEPAAIKLAIAKSLSLAASKLPTTHIEGKATLTNNGGPYAGRIEAMIQPMGSSSILTRVYSDFITMAAGETKTVRLVGTFTRGEVGTQYRIVLRNPNNLTKNYVWGTYVNFTVTAPLAGDVNVDGSVDVTDITALNNAILGNDVYPFDQNEADADGSGTLDVSDTTTLGNILLSK